MSNIDKLLCVTNRLLCSEDFLKRVREIAAYRPAGLILREKDLDTREYLELAREVLKICREFRVPCILHSFADIALTLECDAIHMPLPLLREITPSEREKFLILGASCHSVDEALEAERLGCTYITAGHIFDTDCKKGLPGRGLEFLQSVCKAVKIPVYAIGGISKDNFDAVLAVGAEGACIMGGLMTCADVRSHLAAFDGFDAEEEYHEI